MTSTLEVLARPAVRPAMAALILAVLLAALDQTIVATALPRIAAELGGFRGIAWIAAAYLLASAVPLLWGKLGDMVGRKRLYLVAPAPSSSFPYCAAWPRTCRSSSPRGPCRGWPVAG